MRNLTVNIFLLSFPAFAGDGAPAYDPETADGGSEIPAYGEIPVAGEEGEAVQNHEGEGGEEGVPPAASETPAEPAQTGAADSNNTIISVGQADENTPPPADTENLEQTAKEAVAESKTPEEIADLIEIEIQE